MFEIVSLQKKVKLKICLRQSHGVLQGGSTFPIYAKVSAFIRNRSERRLGCRGRLGSSLGIGIVRWGCPLLLQENFSFKSLNY